MTCKRRKGQIKNEVSPSRPPAKKRAIQQVTGNQGERLSQTADAAAVTGNVKARQSSNPKGKANPKQQTRQKTKRSSLSASPLRCSLAVGIWRTAWERKVAE
ncbi:unnamed protein product [Mycena citricolor]|uniref:Uncharacterized protein n=1 Tax=Mycena citricolor TaxID=2018698 RepID=A0AAD2H7C2_9AGAR|nr:unnamed protein product [Mycena citricolor]